MRTTLDIDADILKAAKVLAEAEGKMLGLVLSELVRKGLAEVTEGLGGEIHLSCAAEGGRCVGDADGAPKLRRPSGG